MPRRVPPANRRTASILAGLAALTGMLALVVAVPVVLATAWHTIGPPIPSLHDLTRPDDGTVFVRTLCLIGWAAWASFTWATLAEILAQWRGWRLPAVGWQQRLAADLIAAVLVLFASPTVVSSAAAPVAAPAATAVHAPPATSADPLTPARAPGQAGRPAYLEHHVQPGEQLPALAERYLGDKYRWHAIAAATYGLAQPDGRALRRGDTRVYPGWTVRIPTTSTLTSANAVLASSTHPAASSATNTAATGNHPGQTAPVASPGGPARVALEYHAREGDWVWYIAERFLGNPHRYTDIAALNPHLAAKYGTAFPDHIEPGDTLHLPTDAKDRGPRTHATGTTHTANTAAPSPAPPRATPPPDTPPPTGSQPSAPAPSRTPSGQATAAPAPSATATAPTSTTAPTPDTTPAPTSHAATPTTDQAPHPVSPHGGIDVGNRGWVTTDLAAAVAALAALAWIQRRRRYRPRPLNPAPRSEADLTPLPAAVATLHAAHPASSDPAAIHGPTAVEHRNTTIEDDMDDPEPHARLAATVTHATLGADTTGATLRFGDLPALGVGWTGHGAADAARGLIVSVLTSGGPWAPAAEAALVTTRPALTELLPDTDLGADDDPLRLHVADSTESALSELERQLLHRARQAADPDPLPDRPQPAPLVLLAHTPTTATTATQLAAILTVGARLGITAVLLGHWPPGDTWHLAPDGALTDTDSQTAHWTGRQVNTLDPTAATEILHTLREARPGEQAHNPATPTPPPLPAPASSREPPTPAPADRLARRPEHRPRPAHGAPDPTTPPGQADDGTGTGPRLQLRVLGPPQVRVSDGHATTDLRIRRSDGLQLLVYLTVEPAGASSDQLMALLWPRTRPQHSRRRLHTTLSELRRTLIDALGADPIHRTEDRYHLDPTRTDTDLWDLAAAIDHASTAVDGAHHAALHEVIHRYTGPVAEGHTWLWLDPYRETTRRHVLDAYTTLAEAEPDPNAALAIIQDAIRVDPYNENLYQRAMHLHARLDSPDGIHRALRAITRRLGELEIPLSPKTQQTASHLLERHALRERLRHPTT